MLWMLSLRNRLSEVESMVCSGTQDKLSLRPSLGQAICFLGILRMTARQHSVEWRSN